MVDTVEPYVLRRRCVYQAIREATLTTARWEDFRIVHLSIQRTHVHLLVEANDKRALATGMQSFQISAARHLNVAIGKGKPGPRRRGTEEGWKKAGAISYREVPSAKR